MKVLTLARKELKDILSERIYLFTFFLQLFIIVGILILGIFYSQITSRVTAVGNVYLVTDDAAFREQLSQDKRVTLVEDESIAGAKVTFLADAITIEMRQEGIREEMEKVVREAYVRRRYSWHETPNTFNTVYIEIMGSLFIPLILLLPIFISMNILSDSIIAEKERKTLEILLASPLNPLEIAVGKVLPVLFLSLIQIVVWTLFIKLRYPYIYHITLLFAFMVLLSFLLFTIAIISSTVASSLSEANLFLTIFLMLMTFLMFVPQGRLAFFVAYSPLNVIVDISSNIGLDYGRIIIYFLMYCIAAIILMLVSACLLSEDRFSHL